VLDQHGNRNLVLIVLDISSEANWRLRTAAGGWRRIVMNLIGNALKYTPHGFIKVALKLDKSGPRLDLNHSQVTLTITDSGIGMSRDFMSNRLYTPFSQENSFSYGIGLGLSIVRQIVMESNGSIELKSNQGEGTKVTIRLTMPNATEPEPSIQDPESVTNIAKRIRKKRICILHKSITDPQYQFKTVNEVRGAELFAESLSETFTHWFDMTPVVTSSWTGHHADIVICTETSFEYLASIRESISPGRKAPITIFIAIDAIEAAALRSDARVLSDESVVEVISQPCGPHKLAKILDHTLNRYYSPSSSVSAFTPSSLDEEEHPWPGNDAIRNLPIRSTTTPLVSETDPQLSLVSPMQVNPPTPQKLRDVGVLIVDDSSINRRLLVALMKKHHIKYREARDGNDALTKYKSNPSAFDFILMDLSMPRMDGMTSTRHIRQFESQQNLPRTTIIALTGLASASARLEALESGVDGYLTKPVQFKQVISHLGIYAESETSCSMASTPTIRGLEGRRVSESSSLITGEGSRKVSESLVAVEGLRMEESIPDVLLEQ